MELIIAYCGRQLNDDELITLSRNRNFMLRHPEENEYPCSEFQATKILDRLPERGLMELLQSRHPEEIEKTNDRKYCKYHRVISHSIKKYRAFKGKVLLLAKEGQIILGEEDTKESN